ncbi:MAG: M3 family oligoendopeptidase [Culicoidibacterales bacterium]
MKKTWDLTPLYENETDPQIEQDLQQVLTYYQAIQQVLTTSDAFEVGIIRDVLIHQQQAAALASKLGAFANLSMTVNTKNQAAINLLNRLQVEFSNYANLDVLFGDYLATASEEAFEDLFVIGGDELILEHRYLLTKHREHARYLLSAEEEAILAKMQLTGSHAWSQFRDQVTSSLEFTMTQAEEEQTLPITMVSKFLMDADPDIRREAYFSANKAYATAADSAAMALNSIKGESITENKLRGYDSLLQEILLDSHLQEATLTTMLRVIEQSLPIFQRYYKIKARLLGHVDGLKPYDLYAPLGTADLNYDLEAGCQFVVETLATVHPQMSEFIAQAIEKSWIDFLPRADKVGGAFCQNIRGFGESRILLNYNGTYNDVSTLAHELGHAYHGHVLNQESVLNTSYPMPLAETASTFNEILIAQAIKKSADNQTLFTILNQELSTHALINNGVYARFLFEDAVIKRREQGLLSREEICELYHECETKAYGEAVDLSESQSLGWVMTPHYYIPGFHYYNFPYTFGLLYAKGLYAKYLKSPETFCEQYDQMLRLTGKADIEDVTKTMGIDVQDEQFWYDAVAVMEADVQLYEQLANKLYGV